MLHGNGGEGAARVPLASSEASLCHDNFVQHDSSVVGNSVHFSTPAQTPSGTFATFKSLSSTSDPATPPVTTASCSGGQGIDCPPVARASADASPSCSSAAIKEAVSSSSESAFQFCPVYAVLSAEALEIPSAQPATHAHGLSADAALQRYRDSHLPSVTDYLAPTLAAVPCHSHAPASPLPAGSLESMLLDSFSDAEDDSADALP